NDIKYVATLHRYSEPGLYCVLSYVCSYVLFISTVYLITPNTNFSKIRDWYFSSIFHLNLVETGWTFRIPASLRSLLTALLRSEENGRYCRFCSSDWDNPQSPAAPT